MLGSNIGGENGFPIVEERKVDGALAIGQDGIDLLRVFLVNDANIAYFGLFGNGSGEDSSQAGGERAQ